MNWKDHSTWIVIAVGVVLAFAVSFALAWWLYHPKTVIERPATSVTQPDGSVILERIGTTPTGQVKVPHQLPHGSTLVREINTTVTPTQKLGTAEHPCAPVLVQSSVVKFPDGSERVIVSSPNGVVTGGTDTPVQSKAVRDPRWQAALMAGYDFKQRKQVYGGQLNYTRGPFVVGGGAIGGTAFVSAGVRW